MKARKALELILASWKNNPTWIQDAELCTEERRSLVISSLPNGGDPSDSGVLIIGIEDINRIPTTDDTKGGAE